MAGENQNIMTEPDRVPLCPLQIPHGLCWDGTWAFKEISWWLSTTELI